VLHHQCRIDFDMADYIIAGEGEVGFYNLCKEILDSNHSQEKYI
jgi:hypothetical protein